MINIQEETAKTLKSEFGIDELTTALLFERGMLSFQGCRNVLLKEEFKKRCRKKEKQILRVRLADKFCMSMSLVEKITC